MQVLEPYATTGHQSRSITYDDALTLVGTGRFHLQLLAVCGWANAADAVEVMAASFLMPSAAHDFDLTENQKGWLGAIVFIGMLVGGWVWGSLADRIGRKKCLIYALTINSLGGLCSSLSPSFATIMMFRLIAGVGVGGSLPVIFTYFIEFLPTKTRGTYMVYLAWFWMVGAILTAVIASFILSRNISFSIGGHPIHSWRVFYMLCSLPSLSCVVAMIFSPESPRYLLTVNRVGDAKKVLLTMATKNFRRSDSDRSRRAAPKANPVTETPAPTTLCVLREHIGGLEVSLDAMQLSRRSPSVRFADGPALTRVKAKFRWSSILLSKQYAAHSVKLALIWFNLSFGYYGLTLWIPEYFVRVNERANLYTGVSVYTAALISALSNLPGNIWSVFSVKSMGRARTLAISIGLSAVSVVVVPFTSRSATTAILMIAVFGATSVGAWNALNISTAELYSTDVRGSAFGTFAAIGKVGAILGILIFGEFITLSPAVPMFVTASALLVAAGASFVLRETKDDVLQ